MWRILLANVKITVFLDCILLLWVDFICSLHGAWDDLKACCAFEVVARWAVAFTGVRRRKLGCVRARFLIDLSRDLFVILEDLSPVDVLEWVRVLGWVGGAKTAWVYSSDVLLISLLKLLLSSGWTDLLQWWCPGWLCLHTRCCRCLVWPLVLILVVHSLSHRPVLTLSPVLSFGTASLRSIISLRVVVSLSDTHFSPQILLLLTLTVAVGQVSECDRGRWLLTQQIV